VTNRQFAGLIPASVATVVTTLAASGSLTSRPQLMSFILLPVLLWAWLRTERDLKPRWWLVPLVWFWSLCHGFWFLGVGLGFAVVIGIALSRRADLRKLAQLAGVAVASLAVVALNPVGLGVLEAPFAVHSTSKYISEWQRTDLTLPGPLGAAAMIVITALVWAITREGVSWARILLLLSAAFFLWYAVRLVIVAGLVAAPLFANALDIVVRRTGGRADEDAVPLRTEIKVMAAWVVLGVIGVAVAAPYTSDKPADVPLALDPALDDLPTGTSVFNAYELGGWIVWRHPDLHQYIDGLITPYSAAHADDFHRAETLAPGWYAVVRESRAPVALLATDSALAAGLERKGWSRVAAGDGYVLLDSPSGTS
jgi:hypothetical protein